MSSINQYELLKSNGTWLDCAKFILSLPDKNDIEHYFKQSYLSSYDDLKMFIFLSFTTKNDKNLLEIFKQESLPVYQRIRAIKYWLDMQKQEKDIYHFCIELINDNAAPCYIKHQVLKCLKRISCLKKSSSFFYNLVCHLTESHSHEQYNIDAHLLVCCKHDQILDILSKWSINRFEQINKTSALYSKLIRYQPSVLVALMKADLIEKKNDYEKLTHYFNENNDAMDKLIDKVPKETCSLCIDYLNYFEKHRKVLPYVVQRRHKYLLDKAPDEMIQLITMAASIQPGEIRFAYSWGTKDYETMSLSLPKSFSYENYVRLFLALYDTCQWSANHTIRIFQSMLWSSDCSRMSSYLLKQERKCFIDMAVDKHIGKESFLKKLLKEGNESTLSLFKMYPELTTPLSRHLITQHERNGIVTDAQRFSLLHYQLMTQDLFQELLSLFKNMGSDVKQRQKNYVQLLECASFSGEPWVTNVLQWIQKRFVNEQMIVIENFISELSSLNNNFHLEMSLNNIQSVETILDIALNHLQQSTDTLGSIIHYGIGLLERIEYHQNREQRERLQEFSIRIIKKSLARSGGLSVCPRSFIQSYPKANNLLADILMSDVFPRLVSKSMLSELSDVLKSSIYEAWRLPQIDAFLNSFFLEQLPSSKKLQSAFDIDNHSAMISIYLKNPSTRRERVNHLINNVDALFFIDQNIQCIALRSEQHRQFIDKLIQDDKCVTLEKISEKASNFATIMNNKINVKLPGLYIDCLSCCGSHLTKKQQEHITNIILYDYLQDNDVSSLDKLKSLHVLCHLPSTFNKSFEWFENIQNSASKQKTSIVANTIQTRSCGSQPLEAVIIGIPVKLDLTSRYLFQYFDLLKKILNASNALFVRGAMFSISNRVNSEMFFKFYTEYLQSEQFRELGITPKKEVLRLLTKYKYCPNLIKNLIKPLWDTCIHNDVRQCLVSLLLNFISVVDANSADDYDIMWSILEEAAHHDYPPIVQSLFPVRSFRRLRWPLTSLKRSNKTLFETFVNRVQLQVLDHPTSLEMRSLAWSHIESEYCNVNQLFEKCQALITKFDKDSNSLWDQVSGKVIEVHKEPGVSSSDMIINIVKSLMSCRDDIDSKQNAIDNQHDLPVNHRIRSFLSKLVSKVHLLDVQKQKHLRSLTSTVLEFDKTLSVVLASLLINIAQNKYEVEDVLKIFQDALPESYFEQVLIKLSETICNMHHMHFIQKLSAEEQFSLVEWFIHEKNRPLLILDLLFKKLLNQREIDRERRRNILRQLRNSENLYVKETAMIFTVPWKEEASEGDGTNDHISISASSSDDEMS